MVSECTRGLAPSPPYRFEMGIPIRRCFLRISGSRSLNFLSMYFSNSGRRSSSQAWSTLSKSAWSLSVSLTSLEASPIDLAKSFSIFSPRRKKIKASRNAYLHATLFRPGANRIGGHHSRRRPDLPHLPLDRLEGGAPGALGDQMRSLRWSDAKARPHTQQGRG